jgi:TonB family protein
LGFGFNRREATCLTVAFAVHALLFLWKGGLLTMPSGDMPLGDPLLQVGYMSDVPEYSEPGSAGEEGKKRGLFGRVKQFFGGSETAKPASPRSAPDVATGSGIADKIEATGPAWDKADSKLVDKNFSDKKSFKGLQTKSDFSVAAGKETDAIVENRSIGTAASASPNLKEKTFQVSKRDMPFQIASAKDMDQLSNVNMVPVTTGKTTSASVTSLDSPGSGGVVGGAALKSRSLGSAGAKSAGSSGFSGTGRSAGSGGDSGDLALGSASGGGMIDAGGMGSGYAGTGTGGGGGTLGGQGRGKGGGGGQGGGSPYGVAGGTGKSTGMLPRRTGVVGQEVVSNSSSNGETITGELSRRPIREKHKPAYEMDARVALRFRVNASGKVLDGIVVEISSGSPSFDNKVIAALKQWLFSMLPAEKSNVIQEGVITFIFRGE